MYKKFFKTNKLKDCKNSIIGIDGTPGVGKTTFLNLINKELGFNRIDEPVEENPFLEAFYKEKEKFFLPTQLYFLLNRYDGYLKAIETNNHIIVDKPIYSDFIYIKILYENKMISKKDFKLYNNIYNRFTKDIEKPKLMIYLKADLDIVLERIKKRNREFEQTESLSYWNSLIKEHDNFFKYYNFSKILTIDTNNLNLVDNDLDKKYVVDLVRNELNH